MNRLIALAGLATCLILAASVTAQDKGKPEPKPIIIHLDASKLPPDVLKKLLELAGSDEKKPNPKGQPEPEAKPNPKGTPEPGAKPNPKDRPRNISLSEAIAIAEKTAGGFATRAERKGEGADLHYQIDLIGKDGEKRKLELDPTGKPRSVGDEKKPDEKKPPVK